MKKKTLVFVIVSSVLFIATVITSYFLIKNHNKNIRSLTVKGEAEPFVSGEYITYTGGDKASIFFNEYIDLTEYENIRFYFADSGRQIALWNLNTIYVVDVQYSEAQYGGVLAKVLQDASYKPDGSDPSDKVGNFLFARIDKEQEIYENNLCCVYYDSSRFTLRYVFICNYDSLDRNYGPNSYAHDIELHFWLKWNRGLDDLVFP